MCCVVWRDGSASPLSLSPAGLCLGAWLMISSATRHGNVCRCRCLLYTILAGPLDERDWEWSYGRPAQLQQPSVAGPSSRRTKLSGECRTSLPLPPPLLLLQCLCVRTTKNVMTAASAASTARVTVVRLTRVVIRIAAGLRRWLESTPRRGTSRCVLHATVYDPSIAARAVVRASSCADALALTAVVKWLLS
jgi:hypothetical protein